jgi:hypothetical protein
MGFAEPQPILHRAIFSPVAEKWVSTDSLISCEGSITKLGSDPSNGAMMVRMDDLEKTFGGA